MKKMLISSAIALSLFSLSACATSKAKDCGMSDKSKCAKKTSCCQTPKKHCPLGF